MRHFFSSLWTSIKTQTLNFCESFGQGFICAGVVGLVFGGWTGFLLANTVSIWKETSDLKVHGRPYALDAAVDLLGRATGALASVYFLAWSGWSHVG